MKNHLENKKTKKKKKEKIQNRKTSHTTILTTQPSDHPSQHQTHQTQHTHPSTQHPTHHPNTRPVTPPKGSAGRRGEVTNYTLLARPKGRKWRTPNRREWSVNRRQRGVRANHARRRKRCREQPPPQGEERGRWSEPPSHGEVKRIHVNVLSCGKGNGGATQGRQRKEAPPSRRGGEAAPPEKTSRRPDRPRETVLRKKHRK